jgi:hypothetical protein
MLIVIGDFERIDQHAYPLPRDGRFPGFGKIFAIVLSRIRRGKINRNGICVGSRPRQTRGL